LSEQRLHHSDVAFVLSGVAKHYIGQSTGCLSASNQKNCLPRGSGPHLMGQIGSGVWVSASFIKKNDRLMGRLGSGTSLVADIVYPQPY